MKTNLSEDQCIGMLKNLHCSRRSQHVEKMEQIKSILQEGRSSIKIFNATIELCCETDITLKEDVVLASDLLALVISHPFNTLTESLQADFLKWCRGTINAYPDDPQILSKLLKVLQKIIERDLQFCHLMFQEFYSCPIIIRPIMESCSLPYPCILEAANLLHLLTYHPAETGSTIHNHKIPENFIASAEKIVIECLKSDHQIRQRFPEHVECYLLALLLSTLYNLVISCPKNVLGGVILSTCCPFMFWGKAYSGVSSIENTELATQLPDENLETTLQPSYTNRNRRRRVNRRKAQPLKVVLKPNSTSMVNMSHSKSRIASINSSRSTASELKFQPHWMQKKEQTEEVDPFPSAPAEEVRNTTETLVSKIDDSWHSDIETYHLNSKEFLETVTEDNVEALQAKVRQWSLILINALVSTLGKHNKFTLWPQLVSKKPSLMTCILHDSHAYVRMAALQVLQTFLTDSRPVLSVANDKDEAKSFTTLSRQYGTNIREIHRCLGLGLLSEKSSLVLVRILKTIELLFENISYHNLKPGLLTKVVTHVKDYLRCKESVVRANAFSVMVSFLMIKPQTEEQRHLLIRHQNPTPKAITSQFITRSPTMFEEDLPEDGDFSLDQCNKEVHDGEPNESETKGAGISSASWIIQRCVDSLLMEDQSSTGMYVQVQLQSLKVLSALVDEHLPLIKDSIPLIQHIISKYCYSIEEDQAQERQNVSDVVPEHAYLLLGSLLNSVKAHIENTTSEIPEASPCLDSEIASSICIWSLQHPLRPLICLATTLCEREAQGHTINLDLDLGIFSLKSLIAASKAFSHLHGQALLNMGETQLRNVLIVTLFLLRPEHSLRLSGLRIVGLLVSYEAIQQNPMGTEIVQKAMEIAIEILATKDVNTKKHRLTAAWALANISGTLGKYREAWKSSLQGSLFSDNHIKKFLKCCINGCDDKDKIKTHIIRFAGNMVAFIPPSLIATQDVRNLVDEIVLLLMENGTSGNPVKMRWNACHALDNIVSSSNMNLQLYSWRGLLIQKLSKLVEDAANFKVRIMACTTLSSIQKREDYGPEFVLVWKALFKCLQTISDIIGLEKLKHREELICQILVSICHLVELMSLEDLTLVEELITNTGSDMEMLVSKYNEMLPPAKASCFLSAFKKLRVLQSSEVLTRSQRNTISILQTWLQSDGK